MNISHAMASRLTEVAREEIEKWKIRSLASRYPVIFVDGTYFPVRRRGKRESMERVVAPDKSKRVRGRRGRDNSW